MPTDDFVISVATGVDVDIAVGRPWSRGIHVINRLCLISAVASGTSDIAYLYMGREQIPLGVLQGATLDTNVDIMDVDKQQVIALANIDAMTGQEEAVRLVVKHAAAAAVNHRLRITYDQHE